MVPDAGDSRVTLSKRAITFITEEGRELCLLLLWLLFRVFKFVHHLVCAQIGRLACVVVHDRGRLGPLISKSTSGTSKISSMWLWVNGIRVVMLLLRTILFSLIRAHGVDLERCNVLNMIAFVGVSCLRCTWSVVGCRERERLSWFERRTLCQLRCNRSVLTILSLVSEHVLSSYSRTIKVSRLGLLWLLRLKSTRVVNLTVAQVPI